LANSVRSEFSTKVRIAASSLRTTILTLTTGDAAGDGMADATGFGVVATAGLALIEGDPLCPCAPDTNNINRRKLSPKLFLFIGQGRKGDDLARSLCIARIAQKCMRFREQYRLRPVFISKVESRYQPRSNKRM
jgi:hypothetical protein